MTTNIHSFVAFKLCCMAASGSVVLPQVWFCAVAVEVGGMGEVEWQSSQVPGWFILNLPKQLWYYMFYILGFFIGFIWGRKTGSATKKCKSLDCATVTNVQALWWGTQLNALWSCSNQKLPPSFERQCWDNLRLSFESEKACYTTHLFAKKRNLWRGNEWTL